MKEYCCEKMAKEAKLIKDKILRDHTVVYDYIWREYSVYFCEEKEKRDRVMLSDIYYCPWCGATLPKQLSDEWFDILEKEYGIVDPSDKEREKVPPEFKTDEWWKKRGL
jgi:hypothetical protein